eukprot:11362791-Ditylum_brightwellii.AAC.1
MFNYTNAQLLVLKVQGCRNKEGKDGEFMNKPIVLLLFCILNHKNEVDSDDNEDSISDDDDTDIKDGVFVFYRAMIDRSLKEIFPQCKQFDDLYFSTSGLGI